ncbi:hypothetical protein L6164_024623 [Bauhinia variegata]|uniref:Uncharacterized protein n=1 Tax=Bauhinia variegata TaxID=167791 RepID=A0ACB9LZI4_BAUVA|nr:hypothetical protein L6164_024623 [Bauhinia variegata]
MSILSWLFCVLVTILIGHYGRGSGQDEEAKVKVSAAKNVFILGGQSNMAGRGGVRDGKWDGNVPPECKSNPLISRFNAQLQWAEAREPLHADIDVGKTCGVGPGMAFANEAVRARIGEVGLVPCAIGGTRISNWTRGSPLYNNLVRRATESVKDGSGTIRALVWYQGESDTVREEDAVAYKANFQRFILDLRSDLRIPSLLIIQVALASGEGKFTEKVREAQLGIKLSNVKCVDAKGLQLKEDKLHLTTASEVHLGIKLARAYLSH